MKLFRETNEHKRYWKDRKIDWKTAYLDTWNHPHRYLLTAILKQMVWKSLVEIGCGAGANLVNIVKNIPGIQVGGVDINKDAIDEANKALSGAVLKVGSADDIMMSDKSTDVVLSDMTLIYVSPKDIERYILEIKRIARTYVVLCEFHSESWWQRTMLKFRSGYNAYDWKKLLERYGFCDIVKYKLREQDWPGGDPQKTFGYVFVARVPDKYN